MSVATLPTAHQIEVLPSPLGGYRASCSCGWRGLSWSVPGRGDTSSLAMCHADGQLHRAEAQR